MKKGFLLIITFVAVALPKNAFGKRHKAGQSTNHALAAQSTNHTLLAQAGFTPLIRAILLGENSLAVDMIVSGDDILLNQRNASGVSAFSVALYKGSFDVAKLLLDNHVQVTATDMNWIIKNFNFAPIPYDRGYFSQFASILTRLYKIDPANIKFYLEGKTPVAQWNDWMNKPADRYVDVNSKETRGDRIMAGGEFYGDFV